MLLCRHDAFFCSGVGGLSTENEPETQDTESPYIRQKRLEFNCKLRDNPTDVQLWIQFIDFQVHSNKADTVTSLWLC